MRAIMAAFATFTAWIALTALPARASVPLDLGTASAEALATLPGVTPGIAQSIVALRTRRGQLGSVEELRVLDLDESVIDTLRANTETRFVLPAAAIYAGPGGAGATADTVDGVMAAFAGEPTIQQVQLWASDYANASPDRVRHWMHQAVTFAAFPEVTVDLRLRNDWDEGFDYFDASGADPTPNVDVVAVPQDVGQGQTQEIKLRLRWQLDNLVMSSERIRVINEAQDVVKLRDKVLAEVTRLYFERRRLQVERLLAPKIDLMAQVKDELRLLELTANIDALTGGAFSGAVGRAGGEAR